MIKYGGVGQGFPSIYLAFLDRHNNIIEKERGREGEEDALCTQNMLSAHFYSSCLFAAREKRCRGVYTRDTMSVVLYTVQRPNS
jgi:hypothetical protein